MQALPEPSIVSTRAEFGLSASTSAPSSKQASSAPSRKRHRHRYALPLRSEPGKSTQHAMQIPEIVSLVLDCLTERDLGWDPENLMAASLVNPLWLEAARPILLREIAVTPGLSTNTEPDTRCKRLIELVSQKSYSRYVKTVMVQFSRKKERARKAAPGRGPDATHIASLLTITSWVQWLRVTNVDPYVFTSILQEPLRQLTSLRHVGLVFDSRPAASKDDFSILEVVSNLLSLWLHLNTLFLTRLQDFTLSSAVEPQSIFPTLPKLHTLTLRECRLTDNLLLQLFQSLPNLLHLEIYRPDLTFHKLENMQQALSIVQQSLHTLRLAGWPDALPPKIVAAGLPLLQDLSIETMHLDRTAIIDALPPNVSTLRLVSHDQKPITQTFVARVKRRLHKTNALQLLKLPMMAAPAKIHRSELYQVCQSAGVLLAMGPEQVTVP